MGINNGGMDDTTLKEQEQISASMNDAAANAKLFSNATETASKAGSRFSGAVNTIGDKAEDLGDTMDKLMKSIHNLPGVIENLTKVANKNMAYAAESVQEGFIKGLFNEKLWSVRAELGRETEELRVAMESARQAVEQAKDSNDEYEKHTAQLRLEQLETAYNERKQMKASQQLNKKLAYDMKKELVKIGQQMFSDLWKYAQQILDQAYTKDKSTIEQSYQTVMSYNSYSQGEYAKLIDRLQEKIDASGLGDVISVNTLQENLVKTLQTGLQGQVAEANAYYASLAEKSGITFDWYGTEWTQLISQMSAQGKDYHKLMESMITVTDDLAEYYGDSTGLAQGKAQQMNAYASSIGATYGLDADAISNIYKSYAVTSQELSKYGIDASNVMQDITKVLESGINNEEALLAFATNGMTADDVEAQIKAGNFDTLVTNYMQNAEAMYKGQNGEMIKALTSGLGGSFNETNYQALQTYWEQEGSFTENFNAAFGATGSSIENIEGELENYITEQESYETKMENNLAKIAEFYTQNPILEVISKTLQSGFINILSILGQYLMMKSLLGGFNGGGAGRSLLNMAALKNTFGGAGGVFKNAGAAKSLFSGGATFSEVAAAGGKGSAVLGKAGQLLTNGTAFASKGGSLAKIGSTVFSTGGKALGVGGSILSIGLDAVKGYKEDGWNGAFRSGITGSSDVATSGGDVAKGAGSAALKGAGIGMLFGPLGAGIGAAVGGLAGLTIGLLDVADKQKQLKASLEGLNTAAANFSETLTKSEERQVKTASLDELAKKAKQGDISATRQLAEIIPDVNQYLDENGVLQTEYGDTLDRLINLEQQKLYREDLYDYGLQYNENEGLHAGKLSKTTKTHLGNLPNAAATKAWDMSVDELSGKAETANKGSDEVTSWQYDPVSLSVTRIKQDGTIEAAYANNDGQAALDWDISTLKSLGAPDEIIDAVAGGLVSGKAVLAKLGYFGDITQPQNQLLKQEADQFDTWYNNYKDTYTEIQKAVSSLNTVAFTPDQIKNYAGFSSWASITSAWPADAEFTAQNTFDRAFQVLNSIYSYANSGDPTVESYLYNLLTDTQKSKYKSYAEYLSDAYKGDASPLGLYNKFNSIAKFSYKPKFAVGTTGDDTIPYDNYLALLHKGEQVRTAADVAIDKAEQHVASTDVVSKINDTLLVQTNTIIDILTNIYNVIKPSPSGSSKKLGKLTYDLPGV